MNRDQDGEAAVTGVAQGSMGTGTALDDTQEWVIPAELQATSASEPAPSPTATHKPEPTPAPEAGSRVSPAAGPPVPTPAPVARHVEPVHGGAPTARRQPSHASAGGFTASPRSAGIAAVVLLALVGVTAVVTSRDQTASGPSAPEQVTTPPTDAPAANPGGNGNANGNGKDKDKDKDKNGNGNGKAND